MTKGILEDYAGKKGWSLCAANILVEGTSDQAYLTLASKLHRQATGKSLVGVDLAVFPPGDGHDGGAFGIQEQFPTICNLSNFDLDQRGRRRFRVVALLDGDENGKFVARSMIGANRSLLMCRDVFVLQRAWPRRTTDPSGLQKHFDEANRQWKELSTVIEDLVDDTLFDLFFDANPDSRRITPRRVGDARHASFPAELKAPFRRFVESEADLSCMVRLVEMLQSMRYYLGLAAEGV